MSTCSESLVLICTLLVYIELCIFTCVCHYLHFHNYQPTSQLIILLHKFWCNQEIHFRLFMTRKQENAAALTIFTKWALPQLLLESMLGISCVHVCVCYVRVCNCTLSITRTVSGCGRYYNLKCFVVWCLLFGKLCFVTSEMEQLISWKVSFCDDIIQRTGFVCGSFVGNVANV